MLKIFIISLFLLGCSSWDLKDRCEKTNWFEYSQKVAYNGKYLEEDGFIKECKEVDRMNAVQLDLGFKQGREKMCQYDEIYKRAKEGIPVFFNFCDGLERVRMKQRFAEGLVIFCTADSGYRYGKTGKIYQNLCPPDKELLFLPRYHQGRKEFLIDEIARLEKAKSSAESERVVLFAREAKMSSEYSSIPSDVMSCDSKNVFNEALKVDEKKLVCSEPAYIQDSRRQVSDALSTVRDQIYKLTNDIKKIESELKVRRIDLQKVPNDQVSLTDLNRGKSSP